LKILRIDNAGENRKLQARCESSNWKLEITYEYTARDTPQQDSLVKVAIANVNKQLNALMARANVPDDIEHILYHKAGETVVKVDGLVPVTINGETKTRYENWNNGKKPSFAKHLRTWGEAGTVKVKKSTSGKLDKRGIQCMFVG